MDAPEVPAACLPHLQEARAAIERAVAVEGLWFRDEARLLGALRDVEALIAAAVSPSSSKQGDA